MIEYNKTFTTMQASCDHCSYEEEYEGGYTCCIEQMREDGWKITCNDGEYDHKCGSCVEDEDPFEGF